MPSKRTAYLLFNDSDSHHRFRAAKYAQAAGYVPVYPTIMGDFFAIKQDLRRAKDNRISLIRKSDEIWAFGEINATMWDLINYARSIGKTVKNFAIISGEFQRAHSLDASR